MGKGSELFTDAYRTGRDLDLRDCVYGPASHPHPDFLDEPMAYYGFLAGLVAEIGAISILEIGTHFGGSAKAMAKGMRARGARDGMIHTLDVASFESLSFDGYPEITQHRCDAASIDEMNATLDAIGAARFDLVYIDALKDYDFVRCVIDLITAQCEVRWLVLDDTRASASMARMWRLLEGFYGENATEISQIMPAVRDRKYGLGVVNMAAAGRTLPIESEAVSRARFKAVSKKGIWRRAISDDSVPHLRSAIRSAESEMLYLLARDCYTGFGEIMDVGCSTGRSTVALAAGLEANARAQQPHRRIHSFDLSLNAGSHRTFLENTAQYAARINCYTGDFCQINWIGREIEVMLTDVANNPALNARIYSHYLPHWVPGRTFYVQQGFIDLAIPAVHYTTGFLIEHFEVLEVVVPSLVLGYVFNPPAWKIQRIVEDDFTPAEKLNMILSLVDWISGEEAKGTLVLVAACTALDCGLVGEAERLLSEAREAYGGIADRHYQKRLQSVAERIAKKRDGSGASPKAH